MTYAQPGVYVSETLQALSLPGTSISPSVGCFAGEHYRGPTYPVLIQSWGQFLTYFGGFNPFVSASIPFSAPTTQPNPYLPFAVYEFFANGGQQCWVYRIINSQTPGATASVNVLNNAATPQVSISFQAGALGQPGNPGAWGNNISLVITASLSEQDPISHVSHSFSLAVLYNGSQVEFWPDLSILPSSPRYFVSMINSATAGSAYIFATNAAPLAVNTPLANTYALTGGSDPGGSWSTPGAHSAPSVPDRTAVVTTSSGTPSPLDAIPGMINLNLPGESVQSVLQAGAAYADSTGAAGSYRPFTFFVADTAQGLSVGQVVANMGSANNLGHSSAAVYYPWATVADPSSANAQATVSLPPGGLVIGQYAATDASRGVWKAPAGLGAQLTAKAVEQKLSTAQLGLLNTNNLNALRTLANGQIVIWGSRTQLPTYPSKYVPIRRTLDYIEASLAAALDFAVFEPNDQLLWTNISNICTTFLNGIQAANGFPGATQASSFYVICNSTNNTPQTVQAGIVTTTVGVALEFPAEFVQLNIVQYQTTGQTVVTTQG